MTARTSTPPPPAPDGRDLDAHRAERAWCAGDPLGAMELADRALTDGTDPDGRAAGVAAAASAADGALRDAARRWRAAAGGATTGSDARAAAANARAALVAALAGDVAAAERDLAAAVRLAPDPAPRGLAVLLEGVGATLDALRGDVDRSARRLLGLAAVTVPPDLLAAERWDELAGCVAAAGGEHGAARLLLDRDPDESAGSAGTRRHLLRCWLDLRSGHLSAARDGLAAVADGEPVLRRNAVLAAAVSAGLTRRSGGEHALATVWHRVAPVVAGADVEIVLLDVWGELSVAAAAVSPVDRDAIAESMAEAVRRAGAPWWAVAADRWWQVERAAVTGDAAAAGRAAGELAALAGDHPRVRPLADAAAVWAAVLAGDLVPSDVELAAAGLAAAARGWEAAALCRAAAARATDADDVRALLGAGRRLTRVRAAPGSSDDLSTREREVGALVLDGLTHREIGVRLYISPKTVEQHVARLRQKLSAANRAALVAALRERL